MEAEGLHLNIDYVGSSGVILSTEQKAAFQSSLVILKNNYKFKRVLFWGKILGVKDDYFIVEGIGKDELRDRQILYRLEQSLELAFRHVYKSLNVAFFLVSTTNNSSSIVKKLCQTVDQILAQAAKLYIYINMYLRISNI